KKPTTSRLITLNQPSQDLLHGVRRRVSQETCLSLRQAQAGYTKRNRRAKDKLRRRSKSFFGKDCFAVLAMTLSFELDNREVIESPILSYAKPCAARSFPRCFCHHGR